MSYVVDDALDRIDTDMVWDALRDVYWAKWRSREDIEAQIRDAWRVIGVYEEQTGEQVGFARAVSDGLGFAYLADVVVVEAHRGNGLGKRIVQAMIDDGPGAHFRWIRPRLRRHASLRCRPWVLASRGLPAWRCSGCREDRADAPGIRHFSLHRARGVAGSRDRGIADPRRGVPGARRPRLSAARPPAALPCSGAGRRRPAGRRRSRSARR